MGNNIRTEGRGWKYFWKERLTARECLYGQREAGSILGIEAKNQGNI
jgi:hypothetical protein